MNYSSDIWHGLGFRHFKSFAPLSYKYFLPSDLATEIKPDVGKEATAKYQGPEYFGYNNMSFYDIEKSCEKQRVPQPKSGLTEYWWYLFFF